METLLINKTLSRLVAPLKDMSIPHKQINPSPFSLSHLRVSVIFNFRVRLPSLQGNISLLYINYHVLSVTAYADYDIIGVTRSNII